MHPEGSVDPKAGAPGEEEEQEMGVLGRERPLRGVGCLVAPRASDDLPPGLPGTQGVFSCHTGLPLLKPGQSPANLGVLAFM